MKIKHPLTQLIHSSFADIKTMRHGKWGERVNAGGNEVVWGKRYILPFNKDLFGDYVHYCAVCTVFVFFFNDWLFSLYLSFYIINATDTGAILCRLNPMHMIWQQVLMFDLLNAKISQKFGKPTTQSEPISIGCIRKCIFKVHLVIHCMRSECEEGQIINFKSQGMPFMPYLLSLYLEHTRSVKRHFNDCRTEFN